MSSRNEKVLDIDFSEDLDSYEIITPLVKTIQYTNQGKFLNKDDMINLKLANQDLRIRQKSKSLVYRTLLSFYGKKLKYLFDLRYNDFWNEPEQV